MDELDLLRSHRREQAEPNPVARQATLERLQWLTGREIRRDAASRIVSPSKHEFGRLSRSLLWVAGVDVDILALCPSYEHRRRILSGAAMLTATIASAVCVALAVASTL